MNFLLSCQWINQLSWGIIPNNPVTKAYTNCLRKCHLGSPANERCAILKARNVALVAQLKKKKNFC